MMSVSTQSSHLRVLRVSQSAYLGSREGVEEGTVHDPHRERVGEEEEEMRADVDVEVVEVRVRVCVCSV
jgi:hypothetical protein